MKILRLPEVMQITGLSRTVIYRLISKKLFPAQIPLGERSVGWLESEVLAWIEDRVSLRSPDEVGVPQ